MVCGNFILPEPASYVFFYAIFNLRNLLYIIRNYEADGMAAFMTCRYRVYSPELKRQAVEDYLSGMGSQAEICRKYHIRKRMQLQAWIQWSVIC